MRQFAWFQYECENAHMNLAVRLNDSNINCKLYEEKREEDEE